MHNVTNGEGEREKKNFSEYELDSHLCQAQINFKWLITFELWVVRCEFFLDVSSTSFKLQLKQSLTTPYPYYLILSPSENFHHHEVLPDVPPAVPLDVHLDVYLEVLTSSNQPSHTNPSKVHLTCLDWGNVRDTQNLDVKDWSRCPLFMESEVWVLVDKGSSGEPGADSSWWLPPRHETVSTTLQ